MGRLSYTREMLMTIKEGVINTALKRPFTHDLWSAFKQLGIAKQTKRGYRGGMLRRSLPIPSRITDREIQPEPTTTTRRVSTLNLVSVPIVPCPQSADSKIKTQKACIGSWNAESINKKTSSITDIIIDHKCHLFAITESWLIGNERDDPVLADLRNSLPHFNIYQRSRLHKRGGGICLLAHRGYKVKQNETQEFASSEYKDSTICSGPSSLRLFTIYRPPPSKDNKLTPRMFFADFSILLESVAIYPGELLMLGDFNFHVDIPTDHNATVFLDLLESAGLHQHVQEPTHRAGHTLDLMITRKSNNDLVNDLLVQKGLPSDHYLVKCNISVSRPPPVKTTIWSRKLRDIDLENFVTDDIQSSALSTEPASDLSQFVTQYEEVLGSTFDKHAPLKHRSIVLRPNAPWFSDDLRIAKRIKRRCERRWLKSGLVVDKQRYTDQCKHYHDMLENAKCAYHRKQIADCDDRQLFKLVDRMCKPSSAPALPDHECKKTLANDFSGYFHGKVHSLLDKLDNIALPTVSVNTLESCDSNTSFCQALDPIPSTLLKQCLDPLLPHRTHIVNTSLASGYMPQNLKVAQVTPILKKPKLDRDELKNYRPISNLKFISKTIERVASAQLTTYMQANNLNGPKQSAYRQFHSTETALLRVQNDLLRAVDKHQEVVLILLDYSAAFDTINHELLINRLRKRYGITGTALDWFTSYLDERVQSINIGNVLSDDLPLWEGVPQGSVLGPQLFTMYTAPLGDIIAAHGISYMTYADDTQLYLVLDRGDRSEAISQVEQCVKDVKAWSIRNKLMLNDSKTDVVFFSSRFVKSVPFPKITIGDSSIDIASVARNLGVTMDKTIAMNDHVKNVAQAASFAVYRIGRLSRYLDRQSTERLVHAFVSSRLDCCNSLLFGLPDYEISKLQRVQNSAARLVSRCKKRDHIKPILRELHWLPVQQRVEYKIALLTFKALNGMAPSYISELISEYKPNRSLRSSSQHLLRHPNSVNTMYYGNRSFSAAAPKIWNNLPSETRDSTSLDKFKKSLKTYYFKSMIV